MKTLIDLRTPERGKLVGRYDPGEMRLYFRHRCEMVSFDLRALAGTGDVDDELVIVRSGAKGKGDKVEK